MTFPSCDFRKVFCVQFLSFSNDFDEINLKSPLDLFIMNICLKLMSPNLPMTVNAKHNSALLPPSGSLFQPFHLWVAVFSHFLLVSVMILYPLIHKILGP